MTGVQTCALPIYDCMSYSDSVVATCGICEYASGACSSCTNYLSGTICGSSMECDGNGNCEVAGLCSGGEGSDDPDCGIISCSGWYIQLGTESAINAEYCYNKTNITTNRCEGIEDCKDPNTSDCSSQPDNELQYSCEECQYISDSDCNGATLGSCSNYPQGTPCSGDEECDGNGHCGNVFDNPRIDGSTVKCDSDSAKEFCELQGHGCTFWDYTCDTNPDLPICIYAKPNCTNHYLTSECSIITNQITCH